MTHCLEKHAQTYVVRTLNDHEQTWNEENLKNAYEVRNFRTFLRNFRTKSRTSGQSPELPEKLSELPQIAEKFQKFFVNPKEIDETLSIAFSRYQEVIV